MSQLTSLLSLLVFLATVPLFAAEEPAPKKPTRKDNAEASALEAKIIVKQDTYTLAKDQQGEKFRESLKDPKNRNAPEPPKVDLVLELKNPTDKPITIMIGSDAGGLDLDLQGPGAVAISPLRAMTREFRLGKPVEIAAGKTHEIAITQLKYGMRGVGTQAYWTEPGEYMLAATLRWPDSKSPDGGPAKRLKATAAAVKLTVKAAE